ncbi:MAG: alpha/beta fold hydrolase [SAR324 cluster bacterium]|nr:alpha/beta fold hydrolase [SAR324 cluster bacterium]
MSHTQMNSDPLNLEKTSEVHLVNPELEGETFFWKGGDNGILLIHGLTATTAEVRPLAKRFHEEGFTVSAVLLPGHGTTPEELNQTQRKEWIAACEKAYFELREKCSNVIIGGESAGAILALHLASEHPEIKALLLFAPAMRLASSYLKTFFLIAVSSFVFAIPKKFENDRNAFPWQGYKVNPLKAGVQLLKLQRETEKRLPRIYQPTLIIQANLDNTVDLKSGEMIFRGIQSAVRESHWMEKSNHVVILDNEFEEVTTITLEFVKKIL